MIDVRQALVLEGPDSIRRLCHETHKVNTNK